MSFEINGKTGAAAAGSKFAWFEPEFDFDIGNFRSRSLTQNASENFTFVIPPDFTSLTKLVLIGISNATIVSQSFDLFSDYFLNGQVFNFNSESDLTQSLSFTINEGKEIDISSVFTSLVKNHKCGVSIDHQSIGATINYLGILLEYN